MDKTKCKPIGQSDIDVLEENGCTCGDWSGVHVADGFDATRVGHAAFKGVVFLGRLDGEVVMPDGGTNRAAIDRANLEDVCIGDNCIIRSVNGWLSKLDIGDEVVIENVGTVACRGMSTFGNGHSIDVLNEGGGRELRITAETSAQIAYLSVMYRDRKELVAKLEELAEGYSDAVCSDRAIIGNGASIRNSAEIVNVLVGEAAVINGVQSLKEGTVISSKEAPTTIENGVIADDFIVQQGAKISDGAMISGSLVGEACKIGKQFSSENSVFFANCEGFHSEVCSVFAGPYTVTHHRSTLLIAAMFSFYNAGSGTNQSNHMYKLGPLHQGIMERGCKTGSFSYLLWPSRVGAFTAVIGKHYANFDTSDLPFSYITEEGGKSTLVPAMNYFTVGTMRDGEKWPNRDGRKSSKKLDKTVFDVLSPYTGQKMINAVTILADLLAASEKGQEYVAYNGIKIKRLLLKTCGRYYKLALNKYFGDAIIQRLEARPEVSTSGELSGGAEAQDDEWTDVSGLLCRRGRIDTLIADIQGGKVGSQAELNDRFEVICDGYSDDEWAWIIANYEKVTGRRLVEESNEGLKEFLGEWKKSSLKLLNMVKGDAGKEFEGAVKIGFGIDGNADADFDAVRGTFDGNGFVKKLVEGSEEIEAKYSAVEKRLS